MWNLLKSNITKLLMEDTHCDEDREIKLGCPQLGKVARFAVAFHLLQHMRTDLIAP